MIANRGFKEGVGANGSGSGKNGYHGTSANNHIDTTRIGDQGEFYLRSLYGLMKHPNGDLRPDLISYNGSFTPKLSMEVKTFLESRGRARLTPWGLTYGFTSNLDFIAQFGTPLPHQDPQKEFERMEFNQYGDIPNAAFYYNLMQRKDSPVPPAHIGKLGDLHMKFGDQMILPHDIVFYSYVVGLMRSKKIEFDRAFGHVRDIVLKFAKNGYSYSHYDKDEHQDLHYTDFLSLFMRDPSLLHSEEARERVQLLERHYGDDRIASLNKMTYVGPNGTRIHAFYRQDHELLFGEQLMNRIAQRRDALTHLTRQREKELAALQEGYVTSDTLLAEPEKRRLTYEDEARLERLMEWKLSKDHGPEFSDRHPHSVEPEITVGTQRTLF